MVLSTAMYGQLHTSSHPEGFVQIRVRARPRRRVVGITILATGGAILLTPALAVVPEAVGASVAYGAIRARRLPSRILAAESQ